MYIDRPTKVFFIDRNNDVFEMNDLCFPLAKSNRHLFKTLVDGEMVKVKEKDEYHFLIYDIISLNGMKVGYKKFSRENCDVRYDMIKVSKIIDSIFFSCEKYLCNL